MKNRVSKAFTLVEILIVVVILGILAAIVIPQFTNASEEAQLGNVQSQLQTLRSQIELFRVRNNGSVPVLAGAENASFSDMTVDGPNSFLRDQDPYMRAPSANPRTGKNIVVESGTPIATAAVTAAAADDGWLYNSTTGEIAAMGYCEDPTSADYKKWVPTP